MIEEPELLAFNPFPVLLRIVLFNRFHGFSVVVDGFPSGGESSSESEWTPLLSWSNDINNLGKKIAKGIKKNVEHTSLYHL